MKLELDSKPAAPSATGSRREVTPDERAELRTADAMRERADLLAEEGDALGAANYLFRFLQLRPDDADARCRLADLARNTAQIARINIIPAADGEPQTVARWRHDAGRPDFDVQLVNISRD